MVAVQDLAKEELQRRIECLYRMLERCTLCPRTCGVDRLAGEKGFCGMNSALYLSSYGPHYGEEPELVGTRGSGTIFLTGCNLHCAYCQNYDISTLDHGHEASPEECADIMLQLQKIGCHNINFVTPTHCTPQIVKAIARAQERGLRVPVVYNCGGYEALETLRLLEGVIDIYMPDIKYSRSDVAQRYSQAPDYPEVARQALTEMHRQVGDLLIDDDGLAARGLLVRHLVLPDDRDGSGDIFHFIATEISKDTYVNVMDQYRPCFKASEFPELDRAVTRDEYRHAVAIAQREGLHRGL